MDGAVRCKSSGNQRPNLRLVSGAVPKITRDGRNCGEIRYVIEFDSESLFHHHHQIDGKPEEDKKIARRSRRRSLMTNFIGFTKR